MATFYKAIQLSGFNFLTTGVVLYVADEPATALTLRTIAVAQATGRPAGDIHNWGRNGRDDIQPAVITGARAIDFQTELIAAGFSIVPFANLDAVADEYAEWAQWLLRVFRPIDRFSLSDTKYLTLGVDATSSSSSFATLLSIPVVVTKEGSSILIQASMSARRINPIDYILIRVQVDGVTIAGASLGEQATIATPGSAAINVGASATIGMHTVTLQWCTFLGNDAFCEEVTAPDSQHASLVVTAN